MYLTLNPTHLYIHLEGYERLWSFHLGSCIEVPLNHIAQVSTDLPLSTWRELRAPGTSLPGVIKAGTYYTERGREFWYVTKPSVLTIDVRDNYYKRIVLSLHDNEAWRAEITGSLVPSNGSD
ncbi:MULTISPECIES: hypothetical protein [unclassified Leptolyngbya]|uniref:hypothetical protein n=1 Tax=unclassified Leptolyngbya TaxID=2650499 RepID=UPI001684A49D|nr:MULTISPECIES: hypothetical protein [unclassified Leptolyngbya]MBD1913753.1 hypothetical protein [Leptolyngbya sp. FACHB-8]MBD2153211.1 hypothetical protein [Leptolyngbya sp. FACHB-16]